MMKKNKHILYLGNHLKSKSNYHNAYDTLSLNLKLEGYQIINASSKSNQIVRLLDMLLHVWLYRNKIDYVLIDTFSTLAFYFAFLNAKLSKLINIPYLLILHGGDLPKRLKRSPKLSQELFNNSYKNIAPSNYLKVAFEEQGHIVDYIPNTITINDYSFTLRNTLQPKLLYVRAFAKIYNPILLIESFNKLLKKYPKAELCMVGPDRDGTRKDVEDLITQYNIGDSVKLTGALSREEWHLLSEKYDIFINPTTVDNTPVSLIEVAALGLPIITTDVGGIPYLFDGHEVNFFKSDNIDDLYLTINNILSNTEEVIVKTKKARDKVENFDWEIVKHKWTEILK